MTGDIDGAENIETVSNIQNRYVLKISYVTLNWTQEPYGAFTLQ